MWLGSPVWFWRSLGRRGIKLRRHIHVTTGGVPLCLGRETALPLSAYPPPRDSSMAGRVFLALAGACKFCTVWAGPTPS